MQELFLWLMGDTVGKPIANIWNWLWQAPTESSPTADKSIDEILKHATQIRDSVVKRITQTQIAVDLAKSNLHKIQCEYDRASQEYQELVTINMGNQKLRNFEIEFQLEQKLNELKIQLENSEQMSIDIDKRCAKEQTTLLSLEIDLRNLELFKVMNDPILINRSANDAHNASKFDEQIEDVQSEIKNLYEKIMANNELL